VTGAGKTEVYLRAAAEVLKRDKQVLVLVPEIGLTPLLTGRFRARFGDAVAVLHSGLSGAQRLREWRRIRAGEARVAVGARSALFAPFADLGLLVVDEEHDGSYKQDDGVRYSARDLAVVKGLKAGCPVVLGSATPSMETYQNALDDRYGLIELLDRPTPRPVPAIEVVDLNGVDRVSGKVPLLSDEVSGALRQCFDNGGKAIVLYNRRGYATTVQCQDCGGSYACPSCGVGLVLHMRQRTLTCHYCGFHRPYERACPSCHSTNLEILGRGTERVQEALEEAFPDIPIGRMDADTTSYRGAHHKLLEEFRQGQTRLLVGTQIVAKGHDFPDVHVAVVIGADHILMMPDFRAAERTFALLVQLAGRAGRGDVAGRVLVQTHHPDHYVFKLLGDFRAFHAEESRQRRLLHYPPFTRLALLRIESSDRDGAMNAALDLARRLRESMEGMTPKPAQVLGPVPAALPRLVGRWRFQILVRGPKTVAFQRWLHKVDLSVSRRKGVRMIIDVDPRHLM
jgi:primosomal protein N' (replication factor Y)